MQKRIFFVFIATLALFSYGSLAQAHQDKAMKQENPHSMTIELSGGAEVPGPGDTDGSGTANLKLDHAKGELCYDISVKGIEAPTAAHIHAGAAGKSGAVKVALKKAADGAWKGCVSADKTLLDDIMKKPGDYYVNVHTADFPNGAIRGQLGK